MDHTVYFQTHWLRCNTNGEDKHTQSLAENYQLENNITMGLGLDLFSLLFNHFNQTSDSEHANFKQSQFTHNKYNLVKMT